MFCEILPSRDSLPERLSGRCLVHPIALIHDFRDPGEVIRVNSQTLFIMTVVKVVNSLLDYGETVASPHQQVASSFLKDDYFHFLRLLFCQSILLSHSDAPDVALHPCRRRR